MGIDNAIKFNIIWLLTESLDWSIKDANLYSETFMKGLRLLIVTAPVYSWPVPILHFTIDTDIRYLLHISDTGLLIK